MINQIVNPIQGNFKVKDIVKGDRYIIFDESGNMGIDGDYFLISFIDTRDAKSLHNIMKRKILEAKRIFPELGRIHQNEIKASDAYPAVKHHILECIASKDLSISYICADLRHCNPELKLDKNILYNFLTKYLLSKIITEKDNYSTIHILCDNHTVKITSVNSIFDYIKSYFLGDMDYHINFDCHMLDSDSRDSYVIQAADYVANALYAKYEKNNSYFSDIISSKINNIQTFPYGKFGKNAT